MADTLNNRPLENNINDNNLLPSVNSSTGYTKKMTFLSFFNWILAKLKASNIANDSSVTGTSIKDALNTLSDDKVDKVTGYGLSENDYSDADKTRLANTSGTNTGDQDLSGYLLKSLTQGKTWVGDGSNLPSEVYPDALSGYVTVGTGGQYTTMKAAYEAGKYLMLQVGNITETLTFNATSSIRILGNKVYSITLSATPTSTVAINFVNCVINCNSQGSTSFLVNIDNCTVNINYTPVGSENLVNSNSTINNSLVTWLTGTSNLIVKVDKIADSIVNGSGTNGRLHASSINNVTGTFTGTAWFDVDNSSASNIFLPNASLTVDGSKKTRVSNCLFSSIAGNPRNSKIQAVNTIFTNGGSYSTFITSGSRFVNCSFGTALTIDSGIAFINCETTGLTLSGTKNLVEGGQHTTITVNGNNNTVTGLAQSTSIALGAVTGCNITNNQVDTDITIVAGNTIHSNSIY